MFTLDLIERAGGSTKALRLAGPLDAAGLLATGAEPDGVRGTHRETDRYLKLVNRRFVDRLEKKRWIAREVHRGGAWITLTEEGRRVLQSFRGIRYAPVWRKALSD